MSKVIVRVSGGLGNQMFQYAAGRAFARRHGARLKLDLSGYETETLRRYELGVYPIAAEIATRDEVAAMGVPSIKPALWLRILRRLGWPVSRYYREPHFHFDPGLAAVRPPIVLEGFWQSERYFADAADLVRSDLTPRDPPDGENARIAAAMVGTEAVSLHVRRGDYVTNSQTNAYHGTCSLDYYRASVAYIQERVAEPHFFVFSDDPDWTRANLKLNRPTTYVTANGAETAFRDIELMARCRHHVIANSSFSWWGAWLNPSPDKIVVAPAQWFVTTQHATQDLIPSSWVRL